MAARLDTVCKFICERSGWTATNLQLQKVLYLAQMSYMGQNGGEPLFDASFEAWDYGPVVPPLYRRVRMFGSKPVGDVFFEARRFGDDDDRSTFLIDLCRDLLPRRPGNLIEITHWEGGAWAKNYVPGAKGVAIPDEDIEREYHDRIAAQSEYEE